MSKIKLNKELFQKVETYAEKKGYSSVEEFVEHLLEQIVDNNENNDFDDDVMDRLKGLGYIS